jgi:hypothetical protein
MSGQQQTSTLVYEIVYVAHQQTRLFAEIIQQIPLHQRYWVRPLCLCEYEATTLLPTSSPRVIQMTDVRGTSDIVWPQVFFQRAMDEDILPILGILTQEEPIFRMENPAKEEVKRSLHQFLNLVWSAHRPQQL